MVLKINAMNKMTRCKNNAIKIKINSKRWKHSNPQN